VGKLGVRYVAKPASQGHWRVWDRKLKRAWGNPLSDYPDELLRELNGAKDPEKLMVLGRTTLRP
jgi:hypothetical protein